MHSFGHNNLKANTEYYDNPYPKCIESLPIPVSSFIYFSFKADEREEMGITDFKKIESERGWERLSASREVLDTEGGCHGERVGEVMG